MSGGLLDRMLDADAQRDDALWQGPNAPLFFPLDPLPDVRKVYAKTAVNPHYGFHFSGHTMDYVLRQGETFTRWWQPRDGRWHHIARYHKEDFFRKLMKSARSLPLVRISTTRLGWPK